MLPIKALAERNAVVPVPVTINVIAGSKSMDDLFHAADIFEPFKHFGENISFEYFLEKSLPNLDFIARLKNGFEKSGDFVTAIWLAEMPDVNYVDWSVKAVSNGKKWFLLEPYLAQFKIIRKAHDTN
jgi:hypothetical protein